MREVVPSNGDWATGLDSDISDQMTFLINLACQTQEVVNVHYSDLVLLKIQPLDSSPDLLLQRIPYTQLMKYGLLLDLNLLPTNFIECLCSHTIKEGKREMLVHLHCALHSLESLMSFPSLPYFLKNLLVCILRERRLLVCFKKNLKYNNKSPFLYLLLEKPNQEEQCVLIQI